MDKKTLKNFLYNTFYQIFALLTPLITTPYISRIFGPSGVGEFSYSYSIASYFIMFIMLGLINYGNRTIASVRDNPIELSKNFKSIYTMQFSVGIVVLLIYYIYCFITHATIFSYIFILFVISALFDINWFFYGLEQFKIIILRSTLIKIVTIICIFVFVKNENDLIIYCFIQGVGAFFSNAVLWIFVKRYIVSSSIKIENVLQHLKPNLILFIPVVAISIYKIMDKIMLGMMSNMTQVGFYDSAEKWLIFPVALITSLGTVMLPKMSNMVAGGNFGDIANNIMKKSIIFALLVASPITFGIMSVAKELVILFYGEGFQECAMLMQILLPSSLFVCFSNVLRTQYLIPNKEDRTYVSSAIVGAIVNLMLNLSLIPHFSALGACIGTLAAEVAVTLYQSWFVRKKIDVFIYIKSVIPLILIGTIMYVLVLFIPSFESIYITLFIKICVGSIVYILLSTLYLYRIGFIKKGIYFFGDKHC